MPLADADPVLVMVTSVRKNVLFAPARTPATGMMTGSSPEYPNWRDQSATLQLSLLTLSTGVAYARNAPCPVLVLVMNAATVPDGAGVMIADNANGATVPKRVPSELPLALKNSV